MLEDDGEKITSEVEIAGDRISTDELKTLREQNQWWQDNKSFSETDAPPVLEAGLHGSRMAIRYTALVPATMALLYLILFAGFKAPKNEEH